MQKIGEILVEKGYVTQQQLDGVLAVKGDDAQVGQVLIQWGLLTEQQLMEALEIQTQPQQPPPPQPVHQPFQPLNPGYQPKPGMQPQMYNPVDQPPAPPILSLDNLQTKKLNFILKTLIFYLPIL